MKFFIGFENGEGWHLFYCDSTLGCQIIQDYDLNKLDDLWLHIVDIKWFKVTKKWNISEDFFFIELKLCSCYSYYNVL